MEITCPYCWETITIEEIPYSEESVELILDCEVCCSPIAITADWQDEDEVPSLDVRTDS